MGCQEPIYSYANSSMGNPGREFLSPKNESECIAAGGIPTPYYSWVKGTWFVIVSSLLNSFCIRSRTCPMLLFRYPEGRWQELEWKQRNWTTSYNKTLVNDFSLSTYATLEANAQSWELASIFKSEQFCRYPLLSLLW